MSFACGGNKRYRSDGYAFVYDWNSKLAGYILSNLHKISRLGHYLQKRTLIMYSSNEIIETINMISQQHLDVRTITLGISLFDCITDSKQRTCDKIYDLLLCLFCLFRLPKLLLSFSSPQQIMSVYFYYFSYVPHSCRRRQTYAAQTRIYPATRRLNCF